MGDVVWAGQRPRPCVQLRFAFLRTTWQLGKRSLTVHESSAWEVYAALSSLGQKRPERTSEHHFPETWRVFAWHPGGKAPPRVVRSSQPGPTCLLLTVPSPQCAAEGISVDDHALTTGTHSWVCVGGLPRWGAAGVSLMEVHEVEALPPITCSSLPWQRGSWRPWGSHSQGAGLWKTPWACFPAGKS